MPATPCSFIDQVPDYDCRDGRVYITMGQYCLAMPIHVFEKGCLLGKEAIALWHETSLARVIALPRH